MKILFLSVLLLFIGAAKLTSSSAIPNVKPVTTFNISTSIRNHSSRTVPVATIPKRLLASIKQDINRSSNAAILNKLNSNYHPNTSQNPTEYCDRYLKRLLTNTRLGDGDGCQFIAQCDYDENRYPPFLLKGKCTRPWCGIKPKKTCQISRERLSILKYTKLSIKGKGDYTEEGDDTGSYQWFRSTYQYNSDCKCSNEQYN